MHLVPRLQRVAITSASGTIPVIPSGLSDAIDPRQTPGIHSIALRSVRMPAVPVNAAVASEGTPVSGSPGCSCHEWASHTFMALAVFGPARMPADPEPSGKE